MDGQQIKGVCEKNWDAHKFDCSGFVKAVAVDLEVNTFEAGDNANAIVDKLPKAAGWTAIPCGKDGLADGSAAKAQADAGLFVIAGLRGDEQSEKAEHGHVVVVVTGPLDTTHKKYPTAYWGSLGGDPQEAKTINYAWREGDRDKVHYFVLDMPAKQSESPDSSNDKPSSSAGSPDGEPSPSVESSENKLSA